MGSIADGLAAYTTYCSGCHTANVKNNVMKVANATSVALLDSAIAKVGSMNSLSSLTAQQKLDIVTYINSAK